MGWGVPYIVHASSSKFVREDWKIINPSIIPTAFRIIACFKYTFEFLKLSYFYLSGEKMDNMKLVEFGSKLTEV